MSEYAFFIAITFFFSGTLHGALGFGFPMLSTPLLATFMSMKDAVMMTLLPTMSVNAKSVYSNGSFLTIFKKYYLLLLSVSLGSVIGSQLLIHVNTQLFKLLLAIMLLMYLGKKYTKFDFSTFVSNMPQISMVVFGFFSGVVSGLVNVMIPILVMYTIELNLKKNDSIAMMNACFMTSKLTQVIVFSSYGYFDTELVLFLIPMVIISLFGLWLGHFLKEKMSESIYKKVLHTSLWLMCGHLIVSTFV